MSFFEDHGLFRVSQAGVPGTRGAYVDNCGTDSYLKYDLSPLGLGDKFAIEVSVRGAALKRTDNTSYYLWDDGTPDGIRLLYTSSYSGPRLFLQSKISGGAFDLNNTCVSTSTGAYRFCTELGKFQDLQTNQFSTIRAEFRRLTDDPTKTLISFSLDGQPIGSIKITYRKYFGDSKIIM